MGSATGGSAFIVQVAVTEEFWGDSGIDKACWLAFEMESALFRAEGREYGVPAAELVVTDVTDSVGEEERALLVADRRRLIRATWPNPRPLAADYRSEGGAVSGP